MPGDALQHWTIAYPTMPALNQANVKEFNDGSELAALGRSGGPLAEAERNQVFYAVETLRRDNAVIFESVRVMLPAIHAAGVRIEPRVKKVVLASFARNYAGSCVDQPPDR